LAVLALFCLGALANHIQLGNFQGTYTSEFGLGTFMCQDGDEVYGYSDEYLLFHGTVDALDVLTGEFHQPGTGPCAFGTFELDLTSWGAEGFYICQNGVINYLNFVKETILRPSAAQCGRLSTDRNLNLEGRYINTNLLTLDLCFRDPDDDAYDDDDETVQGSLQREENGVIIDQYITGFWHDNGKIFSGTWYEEFNAGAVMMYLRDNGNVDTTYWTGLFRNEGETFIDGTHANDATRHHVGTWPGPRVTSLASQCTKFEVLENVVLTNLRPDDDDNYYYFVDTIYMDPSDIRYVVVESDGAASIVASIAFIIATVALLI